MKGIYSKRNFYLILGMLSIMIIRCDFGPQNLISEKSENTEWVWLFNGKSTDDWRSVMSDTFPEQGWMVSEKELIVLGRSDSIPAGTDIITKAKYSNFELELEYKLTRGSNSGIKYFVVNNFPGHEGEYLGLEFQLLDNDEYSQEDLGINGNHKLASLYDLIPAPEITELNPPGEWNMAGIIVDKKHVEHWLNGVKIMEFERGSDLFRALVARSKFADLLNFGEANAGHIMLQGHNTNVSFRNVRIRAW